MDPEEFLAIEGTKTERNTRINPKPEGVSTWKWRKGANKLSRRYRQRLLKEAQETRTQ